MFCTRRLPALERGRPGPAPGRSVLIYSAGRPGFEALPVQLCRSRCIFCSIQAAMAPKATFRTQRGPIAALIGLESPGRICSYFNSAGLTS
jgi:hypothetical protein